MMELRDLGFDQWFQAHVSDLRQEGHGLARISAVDRGSYLIRNELGKFPLNSPGSSISRLNPRLTSPVSAIG